jgi:predicted HicB family RNase H-like nuclease
MTNKPGAKPGNTNAVKEGGATSQVQFRCTPSDKAGWVKAAQREGLKLTEWIVRALNSAK